MQVRERAKPRRGNRFTSHPGRASLQQRRSISLLLQCDTGTIETLMAPPEVSFAHPLNLSLVLSFSFSHSLYFTNDFFPVNTSLCILLCPFYFILFQSLILKLIHFVDKTWQAVNNCSQ